MAAVPAACIDTSRPLELDSKLSVDGAFRLEGPITIQLQGPSVRFRGTFVSEDLFKQINEDKTTRLWLVTVLGEPDRQVIMPDGSELMVWAYRLEAVEGNIVSVLELGGGKDKQPTNVTTIVRLERDVVVAKWRG